MTKSVLQSTVKRVPTPPTVYDAIVQSLRHKEAAAFISLEWFQTVVRNRFTVPALIAAAAVAVLFLLPGEPARAPQSLTNHSSPNDIINQSIVNFALIRSGELKPTMVSCYPEGVVGFFERNGTQFAVNVKAMEGCDWYGALSSEYGGIRLAHVVYRIGEEWMYVYQVSEKDVQEGSVLGLPPAAIEALASSGWYTDPDHPDCNVVVWKEKGTVCTAVSTMSKDRLLALLTTR